MILILHLLDEHQVTKEIVKLFLVIQLYQYHDNDYVYHLNPNEEIQIDNQVGLLLERHIHLLNHQL